jgi:hypothetical protein
MKRKIITMILIALSLVAIAKENCGTCEVLGGPGCSPGCPNEQVKVKIDECDQAEKGEFSDCAEEKEKHDH